MALDVIYKPREIYTRFLKNQFHDEAERLFDELTKKAQTDTEANALHVRDYNAAKEKEKAAEKKVKGGKALGILAVVFGIAFIVVGLIMIFAVKQPWAYAVGAVLSVLGIVLLILRFTKIRKMKKERQAILDKAKAESQKRLSLCEEDMATLNALYDWNMPCKIMEKATDLLELDPHYTPEREMYLIKAFGYERDEDYLHSVTGVTSGAINGNPFFLERVRECSIEPKVYTGTLVITWTTTHRDSQGHIQTETHTQTLVATITKPAPVYRLQTRLIYGNEAAPRLKFSRYPSGMSGKSEKEIASFVKSKVKELDKKERKALTNESNFTKMGNDEFDALFGADDRTNEVEFRLLFTPLAQANELDLIKEPTPYGDDFVMVKDKKITSVASGHSQTFDYSADPALFRHYDYQAAKKNFIQYCDDYIQALYFDLAPIMSIPLYQMHKPHEYIYKDEYPAFFPHHEHETMANSMNPSLFRPASADASLPVLLKAIASSKHGQNDRVTIKGTSYETVPHVEMVPKLGGDGRTHMVPVHWIEYIETSCDNFIEVGEVGGSEQSVRGKMAASKDIDMNQVHYERGLMGGFLGPKPKSEFGKYLESMKEKGE